MSVTELFVPSRVEIDTGSGVDIDIDQIESYAYSPGVAGMLLGGAGEVEPSFSAVDGIMPVFSFTTSQVATFLAAIEEDGAIIDTDTGDAGVVIYGAQYEKGKVKKAGAYHMSVTIASGMIIPRSISASTGGPALLTFDVLPLSTDGITSPLSISTTASISSAPTASELYTVGPATVNGSTIGGVQSMNVNFGNGEVRLRADGHVYPTFISLPARRPGAGFSTNKASYLYTLGEGLAITTNATLYLTQCSEGGVRATGANQISIAFNDGRVEPAGFDGSMLGVNIVPTFDGTNTCMVFSLTASLP